MSEKQEKLESLRAAIDAIEPRRGEDRYVFTIELPQPLKDRLRKLWHRLPDPGGGDDDDDNSVEEFVLMLLAMGIIGYERELDAQEKMDAEWEASLTPEERQQAVEESEADEIPF